MKEKAKNIIVFLFVSIALNELSTSIGSEFIKKFQGSDLITMLLMIFTLNVATTNFIISKLNEIKLISKTKFDKTESSLKGLMVQQISLIIVAVVTLIFRDSPMIYEKYYFVERIRCSSIINVTLIFIVLYYLSILWDIGKAMFLISNFKSDGEKESKEGI